MNNPIKEVYSNDYGTQYELNTSLGIIHYKQTKEISLINFDDGEEFLLTDYKEAKEVCEFILSLVKQNEPLSTNQ